MNTCCKEWALKVAPRQACPSDHVGFEEEHACPHCQESYLVWFTSIGNPLKKSVQIVPVTIRPVKEMVHSPDYMKHLENSMNAPTVSPRNT